GIWGDAGGLLIVLNGFGGGDLVAELRQFCEELLFADLEIVTNRISRLQDQGKKPKPPKEREADQQELTLLQRIAAGFEQGQPASALGLKAEEEKGVRSFQLLTLKPQLVLRNISDDLLAQPALAELAQLPRRTIQPP